MNTSDKLSIQGAEENNLKKINVEIPLQKITTIIGVSGSGKSSLIYNVIAAESKRREKIDSGLAECRDYAVRPKFTKIENLPYCVVVKQRGFQQSHSSTLATITGLHELLRDEFVKEGKIICQCGTEVHPPSLDDITHFVEKSYPNQAIDLFAVVAHEKYADCEKEIALLKKHNIDEVIIFSSYNEKEHVRKVKSLKLLNANYSNTIKIHLGTFTDFSLLKNSLETYQSIALDSFQVTLNTQSYHFKYDYICAVCYRLYHPITSSLLSFNATVPTKMSGVCDVCHGHGDIRTLDYSQLIIPDKSLKEHFLSLEHNGNCYKYTSLCDDSFEKFCKENNIDRDATFFSLSDENHKKVICYIEKRLLSKAHIKISKFIKTESCPACGGSRLNYKANAVKLYYHSISELLIKTVDELLIFFQDKNIHHQKILAILHSLTRASVGYLTLERSTVTFSGGELQRVKVAIQLNANYKNLLYILDEPSVGLHAYDNVKFIDLIKSIKKQGNTVIVSEHNLEYIRNSDYFIELGVGGGVNGGNVISSGNVDTYKIPDLKIHRKLYPIDISNAIHLENVSCNNIKNQDFIIPLNALVVISGVSGSGKSSLIHRVLSPTIKQYLADGTISTTYASSVKGLDKIKSLVELDQSQIGINSRSIIATYIGCFDKIRNLFSNTQAASLLDLSASAFSFNSEEGQCEYCAGLGEKEALLCPSCLGSRYMPQVLEVRYKELSIAEVLSLTIDEAKLVFKEDYNLFLDLTVLTELGLGHLTLGRSTPTLSGGEGQRVKLAKSLIESKAKMKAGNFVYILDEPTTGLSYKDINRLFSIFDDILQYNNTIIVIEHNLSIIRHSDYIIDMGLGAGNLGGYNIFSGQYQELLMHDLSITAKALQGKVYLNTEQPCLTETIPQQEKQYLNAKNNKNISNCQDIYLSGRAFEIEQSILAGYSLFKDNDNFKFFSYKEDIFLFVDNISDIKFYAFNPFVMDFFIYEKIAFTDIKNKLLKLSSIGFDKVLISNQIFSIKKDLKTIILRDPWEFRIIAENIRQAYSYGNGWLSLILNNEILELSTRLVSIKHKIIGSPRVTASTFNRYLNSCKECYGSGLLLCLNDDLIINDKELSILDDGFLSKDISEKLKSVMRIEIKPAIKKLKDEGLFDFSKSFNQLTVNEKNIFLHGFIHKKFLKQKGNKNTKSDYIAWKGLYFYIRDNISQFENLFGKTITDSTRKSDCPFCNGTGFNKELELILVDKFNVIQLLKSYQIPTQN
jgi:excinuclease ABC subunit A